ncbi:MAG: single-stranded DNA-binding protein [Actinomyces sp.]|nr:single-stranded DNA-binding protein [Actinomyces sp.]
MAGDTVITVIGNLTADPELRWTQSGAAVADFTVASTPRTYDRNAGEWRDGDTLFMRCSVWRETAENVAESLRKGMRVIVQGRLTQRSYDTQQGERRTVVELQVDEVGPSLRRARAQVTRTAPSGGGGYQSDNRGQQQGGYQQAASQGGGYGGGQQGGYGQGGTNYGAQSGANYGAQSGANYGAPTGGSPEDPWRTAPSGGSTSFGDEPPF